MNRLWIWILAGTWAIPLGAETLLKALPAPGPQNGLYAWGLTFANGHLWVGDDYTGTIYEVDTSTGQVLQTLSFPYPSNHGLAFDGTALWVAPYRWDSRYLYRMSLDGTLLDSLYVPDFAAGDYVGGLAWDGTHLWVAVYYPNQYPNLYRVNPATGIAEDTIPAGGYQPYGLAFGNGRLWNAMDDNDGDPEEIWELDPTNGTPYQHFPCPTSHPRGLAWDGEALWLVAASPASWGSGFALYRIDPYGAGTPRISAPVTEYSFGAVTYGDTAHGTLWVQNIGTAPLALLGETHGDPAFFLENPLPDTVPPGEFYALHFGFAPPGLGTYRDTLWLATNDPLMPQVAFVLQGEGLASGPQIFLPETLVQMGSPRAWSLSRHWFAIVNLGDASLEIPSVQVFNPVRGGWYLWPEPEMPLLIPPGDTLFLPLWYHAYPLPDSNLAPGVLVIQSNDPVHDSLQVPLYGGWSAGSLTEGDTLWHFQVQGDLWRHFRAVRVFTDLNGDGVPEVLGSSENDTLYCLNGNADGTPEVLWTFTYGTAYTERGLVSVPDVNGDSVPEVLLGTAWGDRSVHLISGVDGTLLWTFDTHQYGQGGWVYEVAPFVDLTGDGIAEVLAASGNDSYNTGPRRVHCLNGSNGQEVWSYSNGYAVFGVRAVGDLTGDGIPEVAAGTGDGTPASYQVLLLNGATGSLLWQTPSPLEAVWTVVPLADVTGDGIPDIAAGTNLGVMVLDAATGQVVWTFQTGSFCTDLDLVPDQDGDQVPEIVPSGTVSHVYLLSGRTGQILWTAPASDMVFSVAVMAEPEVSPILIVGTGYTQNHLMGFLAPDGTVVFDWPVGSPVEDVQILGQVDHTPSPDYVLGLRDGTMLALNGVWPYAVAEGDRSPGLGPVQVLSPLTREVLQLRVSPGCSVVLEIYDATGRRRLRERLRSTSALVQIPVGSLGPGVYLLRWAPRRTAKFVVLP